MVLFLKINITFEKVNKKCQWRKTKGEIFNRYLWCVKRISKKCRNPRKQERWLYLTLHLKMISLRSEGRIHQRCKNSDCTQFRQEILQQSKDAAGNETCKTPNWVWSLACATHLSKNLWSKSLNDRSQRGDPLSTHGIIEGWEITSGEINKKKSYHSFLHLKRHLEYNVIHAMFSDHISNTIVYLVILSNEIHASEILTHKLLSTCTSGYIWGAHS